jgi:N utilization substance protein B
VANYAANDAEERANKHLPTAEDLNADRKILSNRFIVTLNDNRDYLIALKKYKVEWHFEPELAKTLFITLKNSPNMPNTWLKPTIPSKQIKTSSNSFSKK